MYILAIETTGKEGSVCLVQKDEGGGEPAVLGEKRIEGSMSHLKELIPSISSLLESQGVSKNEISDIAASVGPGSFTGIRIGVATARALSQAFGLEYAIAVPTLTAFQYKEQAAEAGAKGITVCAIINARRGQVYGMVDGYTCGWSVYADGCFGSNPKSRFRNGRKFFSSETVSMPTNRLFAMDLQEPENTALRILPAGIRTLVLQLCVLRLMQIYIR